MKIIQIKLLCSLNKNTIFVLLMRGLIKKYIVFVFILLLSVQLFAQENIEQIEKIDSLNEHALELSRTDHEATLELSEQALELSREIDYKDGQINSLLLIGTVYKSIAAYDKAAEYYFDALEIARETEDDARISICLNNIGNVYQAQHNYSKSLEYYKMSLNIEEELDNTEQMAIRLYNIGVVYESLDSLDKALTYYYNSLLLEEENNNPIGIYYALYGIAGVERQLGHYESAEGNIIRALDIVRDENDQYGLSFCFNELGKLKFAQSDYNAAINAFDSSMYYASAKGLRQEVLENYYDLSKTYFAKGNSNKAYLMLMEYVALKDTLQGIEMGSKVEEIEARYKVEQKEKEIEFLKELTGLKDQKADSERRNRYYLLISIFLLLVYSVIKLRAITNRVISLFLISSAGFALLFIAAILLRLFSAATDYTFLNAFADVFMYSVPFLFIALLVSERVLLKRYLAKAGQINTELDSIEQKPALEMIQLDFDAKDDDLAVPLKDLLVFEASDNYVSVFYRKNDKIEKVLRRGSLKMVEDQLGKHELIQRCHKSFIVNISNVEKVSGNAQGYKLHFRDLEFSIPVSRSFPRAMIQKLKNQG